MEFTRHYLPMEWEERWRREKERRRRLIEDGGEGAEQVNHELRRIVAFNDARMGLMGGKGEREGAEIKKDNSGTTGQLGKREYKKGEASEDKNEDLNTEVRTSQTYPKEIFKALKEFQDLSVLTDLTLNTEQGKSFHVHSPVLAGVSSLIWEKMKDKDKEKERNGGGKYNHMDAKAQGWSVCLGPEISPLGLQAVLEFAYTGAIATLNRDTVTEIQAAACTLGAPRALDLCAKEEERMKEGGNHKNKERKISTVEQMKISLESLRRLWTETVGCDVILDVDGASFCVHKVILAASSDYFRGMFTCGMRESHQPRVTLPFLLASELEALIGCSYSGTLHLSWDCVFEITCTALQLQFQPALSLCLDFMQRKMEASSCLDVASFAEAYGLPELLEEADDFVLRNFREVSTTAKFPDLPAEKLLGYLRCDGLCVPSELAVFRAVVSWVETDREERISLAGLLMTGVRFPLMTFREFREVRAINLRMECSGNKEVELYGSALKEFGFSSPKTEDQCRVRRPKHALVLVGGDQLNPDVGPRVPSRELWFANSLRSGTGLIKVMEWRRLGEMPDKPRFRHAVGVLGGRLYVVGGCDFYSKKDTMKCAYRYDPMQDSWKRLADMQEFRSNFPLVVQEERLYAVGGDKELNTNVDSVEVYNSDSDCWSFAKPLDQALSGQAITVVDDGIFVSGGFNCKYECLVSMFVYHPETGTTYLADMCQDRAQHCMEALRGRLYVAGGVCNLRKFYTDQLACEVYDPVVDSWSAFTSLPIAHVGAASAVLEEKIYVLGGYCQEDYSESGLIHRYDPSTGRWENMGRMPGAITDIRACLLSLPQHLRQ
ncbi:kelch-like protein 33 [Lampris incognitus]|uniref:kelch-like protein 33 n=1 Tax=Lampris incognitus TaxID=2546036 RepID=UPI0024B57803|nr:kelch-like protein 33 [Lampris incognitus]